MAKLKAIEQNFLKGVLAELNGSGPDIEGSAIVSSDGLMMESLLPTQADEDRVAAMCAAVLAMGQRAAGEFARGEVEQVLIKGSNGYVVLTSAGKEAVLAVLAKGQAKLGMIFLEIRKAAERIEAAL
jgi:predicted regulator of Ras-like GTPase activity (Roadblock/LC7/MglB family)